MGKDGKQQEIPLSKRLRYALEAARGVAWLHGNTPQVLHRDLKLANLLVCMLESFCSRARSLTRCLSRS